MSVHRIEIQNVLPFAGGRRIADGDTFEVVEAKVFYHADPLHIANRRIVDLDRAPRNQRGLVEFHGDLVVIRPTSKRVCQLLVDVPNRGRRITPGIFNRVRPDEALEEKYAIGDAFLYRHGFSTAAIGWQFDVQDGLKLHVPNAYEDGQEITGSLVCQMQPGRDTQSLFFGQTLHPTYKPTGEGRLFEREHTQAAHTEVPQPEWRFGRLKDGTFETSDAFICSEGGFQAGRHYTLVYETTGAPVVGLGLLALRDATTYLRSSPNEIFDNSPTHVIGFGASQTGRVLRHFLYEGLNKAEDESRVFDLLMPHIAGGQRGDFNHRFAQPGSMGVPALGQTFPFANTTCTDHEEVKSASLRDRDQTNVKVIATNTSWEYWRGDAALGHIEVDGSSDLPENRNDRLYLFSGTHHINGIFPLTTKLMAGEEVTYPLNAINYAPLLRAILINAIAWLRDGTEPPSSQVPRIADGSLVPRAEVLERFQSATDLAEVPDPGQLPGLHRYDLGNQTEGGICEFPAVLKTRYPALVSAVDSSLNEIAGIRLPQISLGIGVHSGWNPRHVKHGAKQQTQTFAGFTWLDPQWVSDTSQDKIESATDQLISQRFVLPEDRDLVIKGAQNLLRVAKDETTATLPE